MRQENASVAWTDKRDEQHLAGPKNVSTG
jgi:hypothetical protein